jgi:hypothetical protein
LKIVNEREIKNVINLPAPKRYKYLINFVCDQEKAWGLYNYGWALASDGKDKFFPLWPSKEFAMQCAIDEWKNYQPESILLSDLLEELLPQLKSDFINVGVFYTFNDKGIVITPDELIKDLEVENSRY